MSGIACSVEVINFSVGLSSVGPSLVIWVRKENFVQVLFAPAYIDRYDSSAGDRQSDRFDE
jgi:hypothetical protein